MVIAGAASMVGKVCVIAGGSSFVFKTAAFLVGYQIVNKTVEKVLKIADSFLPLAVVGTVYWGASLGIKEQCMANPNHLVCPFPPYIDFALLLGSIVGGSIVTVKLISKIFVKEQTYCAAYGDYCSAYGARCSAYWTRFSTFCVNLLPCKGNGSK
ncbi:MAG: hypothetical protein WCP39_07635 [Chlamydiota bacterium]